MRKTNKVIISLICCLLLTACATNLESEPPQSQISDEVTDNVDLSEISGDRILIAYFGRWGNTEFPDDIDVSTSASIVIGENGNLQGTTEYVAELIQEHTGGQLHLIQTKEPYPTDYDTLVDQNHREQENGTVPELQSNDLNMEQYDTIFIGYPIWATTIPQPIVSFLKQYDFSGKTVIPFCTHAGYGSGNSYEDIKALCQNSKVLDGFSIEAEELDSAKQEVPTWLSNLQLFQEDSANIETSQIAITVGETKILAELNDTDAAKEFKKRLPLTVSMTRMGEHEYYGGLKTPLSHTKDIQTGYRVGDLAFWTPGDLFAVYFDEPEKDPEGLMILGHITSDLSIFDDMEGSVEMRIDFASK